MRVVIKEFDELTTRELYEILRVRSEVFVVEQNCIYQDLDEIDFRSVHIYLEEDNRVLAYLRVFYKDINNDVLQFGRVLTAKRRLGYGRVLMEEAIKFSIDKFNPKKVYLEAQKYAIGYYQKFGFEVRSDDFLEDGIVHVIMEKDI